MAGKHYFTVTSYNPKTREWEDARAPQNSLVEAKKIAIYGSKNSKRNRWRIAKEEVLYVFLDGKKVN